MNSQPHNPAPLAGLEPAHAEPLNFAALNQLSYRGNRSSFAPNWLWIKNLWPITALRLSDAHASRMKRLPAHVANLSVFRDAAMYGYVVLGMRTRVVKCVKSSFAELGRVASAIRTPPQSTVSNAATRIEYVVFSRHQASPIHPTQPRRCRCSHRSEAGATPRTWIDGTSRQRLRAAAKTL